MALKHVNAVVVGSGAGGGIVAKELAEAGLSVVLLERGKWFTSSDDRKDDLRNQRTSALGASFGPDDRNPRVYADSSGGEHFNPSDIQCLLLSGRSHTRLKNGKFALLDTGAVEELQETLNGFLKH